MMMDAAKSMMCVLRLDWLTAKFNLPILFAGIFFFGSNVGLARMLPGDARVRGLVGLGLPVRAEGRDYTYNFLPGQWQCTASCLSGVAIPTSSVPAECWKAILVAASEPKRIVWVESVQITSSLGIPSSPSAKLDVMSAAIKSWVSDEFGLTRTG